MSHTSCFTSSLINSSCDVIMYPKLWYFQLLRETLSHCLPFRGPEQSPAEHLLLHKMLDLYITFDTLPAIGHPLPSTIGPERSQLFYFLNVTSLLPPHTSMTPSTMQRHTSTTSSWDRTSYYPDNRCCNISFIYLVCNIKYVYSV